MSRSLRSLLAPCLVLLLAALAARSARADGPEPTTTADPQIPLEELGWRLKPLRRDALAVEAEGWATLLQARVAAVAERRIARERADETNRAAYDDQIHALGEQRIEVARRLEAVLAAWEARGGDATELRAYLAAVGGHGLLVHDAGSRWDWFLAWLRSEDGGIRWGRNLLFFLLILFGARLVANLLGGLTRRALSRFKRTPELLRNFLSNSVRNVVFVIGLVVALERLGVDIGPMLAAIGAAGLVIGFALQDTLSNFASGVMILLYRPYELGEVVSLAGVTGKVEAMSLVSTTIKTPDNQTLVVPNSKIWGGVITNVTGSETRRVDLKFGIGYGDDLEKAQRVLEDVLAQHPKVLKDPAPTVALVELADSSVNFNVRPWVRTEDYWSVLSEVTAQVKRRFDAEGISIPFPQRDVHLHQVAPA